MQNGKIKVMRIITRLGVGGSPIQAALLTAGLDKNRFESLLVIGAISDIDGDMSYLVDEYNISPIKIPELGRDIGSISDLLSLYKLIKLMKKEKPDIIHTHQSKAGVLGRLAGILVGVPYIVHTFHGHVFHSYFGKFKSGVFILTERFLAKFTSKLIAISPLQFDDLCKKYRLAVPEKFSLIPLGFDLSQFLNSKIYVGKFREELNLSINTFLVGIVGRLTGVKNHKLFLHSAKRVLETIPNVKFIVVGDGELSEKLKELTNNLGITENVIFLGWRRDMPNIYADLDLVVLTSLNEGTPVALIEAMASGKAVVSTAVGGVPDIIENGKSGILVPTKDEKKLADAIVELLSDSVKRKSYGEYGREFVRDKYNKERLFADIAKLYEELVSGKTGEAMRIIT